MCVLSFIKPYLKDIIFNGVIPFFCVLLGALLSFRIQRKSEEKREDESRYADCLRIMLSLSTMYTVLINIQEHIAPDKELQDRHILLKPFPNAFDYASINPTDLVRVVNSPNGNDLLVYLLHAQSWVKSTLETLNLRNQVHLEMQRTTIQVDENHGSIRPHLNIQLKNLTDGLYEQVDSSMKKIECAARKFGDFASALYPGQPVRKLERINAAKMMENC
ncbi:hypothetical protein [Geothrix campi]|uniref:hypothetical protein n=1 Tax=Geothrix campi TaxID=2966450 RepID=UPI002148D020|nr:hypothetical protein [Geothrix sp. SG10]